MNDFRLGLILALFTVGWAPAQAQNQVWIDIVPMTRQLLGADDATDLSIRLLDGVRTLPKTGGAG